MIQSRGCDNWERNGISGKELWEGGRFENTTGDFDMLSVGFFVIETMFTCRTLQQQNISSHLHFGTARTVVSECLLGSNAIGPALSDSSSCDIVICYSKNSDLGNVSSLIVVAAWVV